MKKGELSVQRNTNIMQKQSAPPKLHLITMHKNKARRMQ